MAKAEVFQLRNAKGKFDGWVLNVKNGSQFPPLTENTLTDNQPLTPSPSTANQSLVNSTYKRKINKTKKDLKEKKEKSSYVKANNQKHDFADSMNQNASEKKQIEQHEKIKAEPVPDYLKGILKSPDVRGYGSMRDVTQERLDREDRERLNGQNNKGN